MLETDGILQELRELYARRGIDDVGEVTAVARVVEPVCGVVVLDQRALGAGAHHRVPELPHRADRLDFVAGAVVDLHRRISRPDKLD